MTVFCPLLKETCVGDECIFSKNGTCTLVSFLGGLQGNTRAQDEITPFEVDIPDWLQKQTPDEIKNEILKFMKDQHLNEENFDPYLVCDFFWSNREVVKYSLPPEIVFKMEKAEVLFGKDFMELEKEKRKKLRDTKKTILPLEEDEEERVPSWLENAKPEEISAKILDFLENEFPQKDGISLQKLFELFWMSHGIERFSMSSTVRPLRVKAEFLVEKKLIEADLEKQKQEKGETEKEKYEEISNALLSETAEALADQMFVLIRKEYPELSNPEEILYSFYALSEYFWESKGIKIAHAPQGVRLRIQKTNFLVRNKLQKEIDDQRKHKLETEKAELASIIREVVEWAKEKGMKKLTQHELHAFLSEKNMNLLEETKKDLYSRANVALKYACDTNR